MEEREEMIRVGECIEIGDDEYEIHREYYRQGWIFKDEDAFLNHPEKPCYVPETSHIVYTGAEIREMCNNQEDFARELFYAIDWQHPESLVNENVVNGEWWFCKKCGHLYNCYDIKVCPECGAPYKEGEDV